MNRPAEQNDASTERYAVEIEAPEEERPLVLAEVTPFSKPDQYTKSAEGPSPAGARRGGGPKTSRGKEKSSRNAFTHGIFGKVTLLRRVPRAI
jgi:hypothetical protein